MSSELDSAQIPIPPIELRRSVGVEDPSFFDNPARSLVFGDAVDPALYREVFDFGCGCGRIARQMMLQADHVPQRFVGIDLYKPSVQWCTQHLTPVHPGFVFHHYDFYNAGLNPGGARQRPPFPNAGRFSLVNAHSVFTHIIEDNVRFYFDAVARLMDDCSVARITWFLFNKAPFPMMQDFQNSLYINTDDPTNAVIYDIEFVKALYRDAGLTIYRIEPPAVRGHQWLIYASKGMGHVPCPFPEDHADIGLVRPPTRLS